MTFNPDGRIALTGSDDKTVRLWKPGAAIHWRSQSFTVISFPSQIYSAPMGEHSLTGPHQRIVNIWNTPEPEVGDMERIELWSQISTALKLDEHGQHARGGCQTPAGIASSTPTTQGFRSVNRGQ